MSLISRRKMLSRTGEWTAAAAVGAGWLTQIRPGAGQTGADGPIRLGLLGCGRRGRKLLQAAVQIPGVTVATVCDVDKRRVREAADLITTAGGAAPATAYRYEHVLEDPTLQAVIIATPDHWHSLMFIMACVAGKDIYIESPLAHTIAEGQAMIYFARRHRRVVQVGLQYAGGDTVDDLKPRLATLGKLPRTAAWSSDAVVPVNEQPDRSPPEDLDYDRWLGPAPEHPYNPARVRRFYHWWDYGGGEALLWSAHLHALMHRLMRVSAPDSVAAIGGNYALNDFRQTPDTLDMMMDYKSLRGPFLHNYSLQLHFAGDPDDVPERPEQTAILLRLPGDAGFTIKGRDQSIDWERPGKSPSDGNVRSRPFDQGKAANRPDTARIDSRPIDADQGDAKKVDAEQIDAELTRRHLANFIACLQPRAEPATPVEAGYFASLPGHLGNIAYRLGRRIYFDPKTHHLFQDSDLKRPDEQANELRQQNFRPPYTLPGA